MGRRSKGDVEGDDFQAQALALRERARGANLTVEQGEELLHQAKGLVAEHPELGSSLLPEVQDAVGRSRRSALRSSLPRRLRRLQGELSDASESLPPTAEALARLLRRYDLDGGLEDSSLELLQNLQKILWPYLEALLRRYDGALDGDRKRIESRKQSLWQLHEALPQGLAQARERLAETCQGLAVRLDLLQEQQAVENVLVELQTTPDGAEGRLLDAWTEKLDRNRWAAANPGHLLSRRVRQELAQRRDRLLEIEKTSAAVEAVSRSLDLGQPAAAIDALDRLLEEGVALESSPVLGGAAERIASRLIRDLEAVTGESQRHPDAGEADLRRWVGQLEDILYSLNRLKGKAAVPEETRAKASSDVVRLRRQREDLLLDREKAEFARLRFDETGDYLRKLRESDHPAVAIWRQQVEAFLDDARTLERVEGELAPGVEIRLRERLNELPGGPITRQVEDLLDMMRRGSVFADEVADAISRGLKIKASVRAELQLVRSTFPLWKAPQRALFLVDNAARLVRLRDSVPVPVTKKGLAAARKRVRRLPAEDLRSELKDALGSLQKGLHESMRLAKCREELATAEPQRWTVLLQQAIESVAHLSLLSSGGNWKKAAEYFPSAHGDLEGHHLSFLQHELPSALDRWLSEVVAGAWDAASVEGFEAAFRGWLERLGEELEIYREKAASAFRRQGLRIQIAALEMEERWDEALEELTRQRSVLGFDEAREVECRLGSMRAVAHFHLANDPEGGIRALLEACRDFGPRPELVGLVEETFRLNGDPRPLASLARDHGASLPVNFVAWTRWALSLVQGDSSDLAGQLSEAARPESPGEFLEALALATSPRGQRYLVSFLEALPDPIPSGLRDLVVRIKSTAEERRDSVLAGIREGLAEIETEFLSPPQARYPMRAPDGLTHTELDEAVEDYFDKLQEDHPILVERLAVIRADLALLGEGKGGASEAVRSLHRKAEALDRNLRKASTLVSELDRTRKGAVSSTDRARSWEGFESNLVHIDQGSPEPLKTLRKMLSVSFSGYVEVEEICDRLVKVAADEGAGLAPESLSDLRQRLEAELGEPGTPRQVRFGFDLRFPGGYRSFIARLSQQVDECAAVQTYEDSLRQAMQRATMLEQRLTRLRLETDREALRSELSELRELLEARSQDRRSLREIFEEAPAVEISHPALLQLTALQEAPWYRRLASAIQLLESDDS